MMEQNRLFIAVVFSDGERAALRRAAEPLLQRLKGRFVDASLYHVTLRFFGAVPPEQIDAIIAAMERTAARSAPFDMLSGAAGSFGRPDSAVLWLGIGPGAAQLKDLQAALARELSAAGFPPEDKPFRAHITLGRDVATQGRRLPEEELPAVSLHATAITLFNSTRRNGRLVYEAVKVARLGIPS